MTQELDLDLKKGQLFYPIPYDRPTGSESWTGQIFYPIPYDRRPVYESLMLDRIPYDRPNGSGSWTGQLFDPIPYDTRYGSAYLKGPMFHPIPNLFFSCVL